MLVATGILRSAAFVQEARVWYVDYTLGAAQHQP
jgi:hypothetical protein